MPTVSQISLAPQQFQQRFTPIKQFSDPFCREYFISKNLSTKKRIIYKHYLAEMSDQFDAIFDNIENYLKLNQHEDICKIVACTRLQQEQQVLAAFQYEELQLGQYIQTHQFHTSRVSFYLQFLSHLTQTIKSMCQIGIDLDQLNYGNILVYNDQNGRRKMKIFYDEREKIYDKILEGVKTFTSLEKLKALITADEEYFAQVMDSTDGISQENIYQLGLLLIDLMYTSQTTTLPQNNSNFLPRDRPVSRSSFISPDKSYYHIEDGCIVSLNEDYINEKLKYLENECSHLIKELAILAREMIKPREERISLMELIGEVERVEKIWRDISSKKVARAIQTEGKKTVSYQQVKSQYNNKQSPSSSLGQVSKNQGEQNQPKQSLNYAECSNSVSSSNIRREQGSSKSSNQNILNRLEGNHNYEYEEKGENSENQKKFESEDLMKKSGKRQYESKKSNYLGVQSQKQVVSEDKKQKPRQTTNSNTLSRTKQTITSKTSHITNDNYNITYINSDYESNWQQQRIKATSEPQIIPSVQRQKPTKMLIPKQHLLMGIKAHQSIKCSVQTLIKQLESLPELRKKQYYDNSVYYGCISLSNKRSGLGLYVYPTGDIYFGTWNQNQLINGTYIFKNGQSYEGSVKNGKQGWGRYRYSNGNVYEGQWKDDIKQGQGTMWYPNHDKYEGHWLKGKKNGYGKYFYNNGTLYEGNFISGRKHGFGTISFPNGTRIEANWHQTHIEGESKVHYPNGDLFHGQYSMSQKHGKGLYIWSDNTKYEGQFKKDTLQGQAKIYFTPNQHYFGRIRNGKRDGQGTYTYQNGDSFTGEWKNDLKLVGQYTFRNGDLFQGKFKDNQLSFGVLKYANDEMYEGEFRNGCRHGVGSYRDRNSQVVCEGYWENDGFVQKGAY